MATGRFYAVEIEAARPGGSGRALTPGFGVRAWGTLARRPTQTADTTVIRASDAGYRTANGAQVYPPLLTQAFAVVRNVNVAPAGSGVAAGAGRVLLANPGGLFDTVASAWNVDGRAVSVLTGLKAYERPGGPYTVRPTSGTYTDANGVLREAGPGVVRWDYGTGSPVALDEADGSNTIRNPRAEGAVVADGVERVTNGDFALDPINAAQNTLQNGWQWSKSGGTSSAVWSSGAVTITSDGANNIIIDTSFTTVAGLTYTLGLDVSTSAALVNVGTTKGGATLLSSWSTGTGTARSVQFTATGTTTWLRVFRSVGLGAGSSVIDNVTVKSAGKLPTYWSLAATSGLLATVIAAGTVNGVPVATLSIAGTAAGTSFAVQFDSGIACVNGDPWAGSLYTALTAGSLANITAVALVISASAGTSPSATHTPATQARRSVTGTVTATTTLALRLALTVTNGAAVSVTLRLGAPQLEPASAVSSVILPAVGSPAVATRSADKLYSGRGLWLDPDYADLAPVFAGLAMPWVLSQTALEIPLRDASYWLEQPVQSTYYAGTGGYDGHAGLAGTPKPKTRGGTSSYPVRNVTPRLVDPVNRIYQWSDGPGTVVRVYEAGNLAFTAGANVSDLLTGSTASGYYRTDNARSCFQLGATAQGEITCDVTGEFPTAGAKTNWADILRYLLTEDCLIPAANVNAASFTAAASAYAYTAGVHYAPDEQTTGVAAADRLLTSVGAKLVPTRLGELVLTVLRAVPATAVPVASFGPHSMVDLQPEAGDQPPYRIRLLHNRNHTLQSAGVSVSATDANRAYAATPGEYAAYYSADVAAAYQRARDMTIGGGALLINTQAQTVADALGAAFATRRRTYWMTVPVDLGVGLDPGDVVRVTWPRDGLDSGALALVVGDDFRSQDATMRLRVWL